MLIQRVLQALALLSLCQPFCCRPQSIEHHRSPGILGKNVTASSIAIDKIGFEQRIREGTDEFLEQNPSARLQFIWGHSQKNKPQSYFADIEIEFLVDHQPKCIINKIRNGNRWQKQNPTHKTMSNLPFDLKDITLTLDGALKLAKRRKGPLSWSTMSISKLVSPVLGLLKGELAYEFLDLDDGDRVSYCCVGIVTRAVFCNPSQSALVNADVTWRR